MDDYIPVPNRPTLKLLFKTKAAWSGFSISDMCPQMCWSILILYPRWSFNPATVGECLAQSCSKMNFCWKQGAVAVYLCRPVHLVYQCTVNIYIYILCNSESLVHCRFGSVRIEWNRNGIYNRLRFPVVLQRMEEKKVPSGIIQTGTTLIALTVSGVAIVSNDPGGITGEHLGISLEA